MHILDVDIWLPPVINIYWILAIFAATVALIPVKFASGFRNAVLLSACRGKLMDNKPSLQASLGPLSDWTVPQSWFAHFYFIGAIANAAIFSAIFNINTSNTNFITNNDKNNVATVLALQILLEFHLIRRFLETTALLTYPRGARMHGIAYIFGMSYYIVVPLSILPKAAFAALRSAVKGSVESLLTAKYSLVHHLISRFIPKSGATSSVTSTLYSYYSYFYSFRNSSHLLHLLQWMGVAVFLLGNLLQFHSHYVLASLGCGKAKTSRKSTRGTKSSTATTPKYRIPRGGAFEMVSCPHYLAEIVIYVGMALMSVDRCPGEFNIRPWLMVAWVVVNLVLAARLTQEWYHRNFRTYPKNRRALVPYIY